MSTSQNSGTITAGEAAVMRTERERASFPVRELTYLLHGGRERTETKERVAAIYEKDPKLRWDDRYFLSREANFEKMLSQVAHTLRLVKELNITDPVELYYFRYFLNSHNFTGTHWSMFVETLEGQGTEEQKAQWLDAAKRYHILGCYAQTELGHGSNVRGLETTATYDKQRQEFVLNSPTLTSTKWWPGGLGLVGTHAVTHARLIIDGKDHGVHAFVVQLRNLEDHKPLPGITVGDIGPKMGFNQNDNGFLRFDHVQIPRGNMLAKYSSVTADGQYVKTPNVNPKIAYATMLYVRAHMVNEASEVLKRACTIAVRYSAVRRQFGGKSGAEKQVLDYQMQQYRLFGLLSKAFAFHFAGEHMLSIYNDLTNSIKQKDLSKLPEVHATSAGLKAFTSWVAAAGTEEARKCCGGHGYSMASGLPSLFAEYVPACTYEGDNVILCLQTARYLLKALQQVQAGGKLKGGAKYLQDLSEQSQHSPIKSAEGFLCPHFQLHAHRHHARVVVLQAAQKVQAQLGQGKSFDDAWNASEVDLVRAVKAHCYLNIVEYFIQGVEQVENLHIRRVLKRLSDLFALQGIQEDIGEYLEDGYFSGQQVGTMRSVIESLLEEIRPDAVALVDSFNFPDFLLNSSLGRHDGNVYEHMYAWARSNPMNATPVTPGYEKHIKPFIQAGKASARL